jgi:hypothetical protein
MKQCNMDMVVIERGGRKEKGERERERERERDT